MRQCQHGDESITLSDQSLLKIELFFVNFFGVQNCAKSMELEQLKQTFLTHLARSDELDDPLSLHVNYIQSLKSHQNDPSLQNFLLEALERTTQCFVEDPRYRNDPRYLRVWLDYAARCREPEDVFGFLAMKGICLDLAAYYEEYAGYLERRKIDITGTYKIYILYS